MTRWVNEIIQNKAQKGKTEKIEKKLTVTEEGQNQHEFYSNFKKERKQRLEQI